MSFEEYIEKSNKLSEELEAIYLGLINTGFIPIGQTPRIELDDECEVILNTHTRATLTQVASKLEKIRVDITRRNEVFYTQQPYCERKALPCCEDNAAGNESNGLLSPSSPSSPPSPPSLLCRKN